MKRGLSYGRVHSFIESGRSSMRSMSSFLADGSVSRAMYGW